MAVVLLLAILAGVGAVLVQRQLFPYLSGDHDEPVYRMQAELLRHGIVTLPGREAGFFRPWLTGPVGDRLVFAFTPVWPAALALAQAVFGTMRAAVALGAAAAVITTALLVREVTGRSAAGVLTAALVALSPLFLMLAGTYLQYVPALALGAAAAWLAVRATRTGGRVGAVASGALWGVLFFARPYDALLWVPPVVVAIVVRAARGQRRDLWRVAGWWMLGAVPLVAGALAFNAVVCGSPFTFPTAAQSDGTSAFLFGERSIGPGTPVRDYKPGTALWALWRNVSSVPTWTFGSVLLVPAVAWSFVLEWRRRRWSAVLLGGLVAAFPLGYLLWWASALTANDAYHGMGPHYYLPSIAAGLALAALGLLELRWRPWSVAVTAVLAVALTVVWIPPKLDDKRFVADVARQYDRALHAELARLPAGKVVVVHERGVEYLFDPHQFLGVAPEHAGRVVYALDRGAATADLLARFPDRAVYRTLLEVRPGDPGFRSLPVLRRVHVVEGSTVALRTTIVNRTGSPVVVAYVVMPRGRQHRVVLDTSSRRGDSYTLSFTVPGDGEVQVPASGAARAPARWRDVQWSHEDVTVGVAFASSLGERDPSRVELRIPLDRHAGRVRALTAMEERVRFGAPAHAWARVLLHGELRVTPVASP